MQVNLFAPQTGNPSYGVVRLLAKDSNDNSRKNNSLAFIDSDGQVSVCRNTRIYAITDPAHASWTLEASWHLVRAPGSCALP